MIATESIVKMKKVEPDEGFTCQVYYKNQI